MLDPLCQPTCGDDTCTNDGMEQGNMTIPMYVAMLCIGVAVGFLVLSVGKRYGKCFKGL